MGGYELGSAMTTGGSVGVDDGADVFMEIEIEAFVGVDDGGAEEATLEA